MTTTLITAFGLMLVLEGVLPLVAPQAWRDTFRRMIELNDGQLRFVGMLSMIIGLIVVLVAK
ncbi:MAG: DUF2065 domain-containing protein [Methylophilaceae bacterium]|nr:DUF2065 domain-containing protein [Methylophilaceae bacterium]